MAVDRRTTKLPIRRTISNNLFILKEINKASKGLVLIDILMFTFAGFSDFVSSTYLLRLVLQGIEQKRDFWHIATFILIWLVLQVVYQIIFEVYYNGAYLKKINKVYLRINGKIFLHASKVDLSCYDNPEYYDQFVKAVDDCATRITFIVDAIKNMTYKLTKFVSAFVMLFTINPVLLIFLIFPIFTIPLNAKVNSLSYARTMDTREVSRHRDYSKRVFYLSDYAKELRLSNMSPLLIKRFKEATDKNIMLLKKYGVSLIFVSHIIAWINEIFTILGATIYATYSTLVTNTMGVSDCIAIINSVDSIAYTLSDSATQFIKLQENALYIENLRQFLDHPVTIKNGKEKIPKDKGSLELKNVSFKYDGAKNYTLKNINLTVGKNEKIAIVGHNGAGKSTLIKLILRLYDPEGEITYLGKNIKEYNLTEYRDIFAAVLQEYNMFALTTADNVLLRKRFDGDNEIVIDSLKKSDLYEKVLKFKNKENSIMTKEFDEEGELLSGGEQQKLSISHVYSKENRFVILDEPSSALDPIAEAEMYNRMLKACENCGMIFISHRLSSAVLADKIYYVENGEILESGNHAELMQLNGKYAKMFIRQSKNYKGGEVNE